MGDGVRLHQFLRSQRSVQVFRASVDTPRTSASNLDALADLGVKANRKGWYCKSMSVPPLPRAMLVQKHANSCPQLAGMPTPAWTSGLSVRRSSPCHEMTGLLESRWNSSLFRVAGAWKAPRSSVASWFDPPRFCSALKAGQLNEGVSLKGCIHASASHDRAYSY